MPAPAHGRRERVPSRSLASRRSRACGGERGYQCERGRHCTHEPLRGQLRIALHAGVTKEEIVELFIHLAAYAGAGRAFDSYQVVLAVFAEAA